MISNTSDKKVKIHITTYRQATNQSKMDTKKGCKYNKFVCDICLNSHSDETMKKSPQICRSCQNNCNHCHSSGKRHLEGYHDPNEKNMQTSDTNVGRGLNLLNEVLTVFQKKRIDTKEKSIFKDAAVSTENITQKYSKRLSISTFYYSIDVAKQQENGKFIVLASRQPDVFRKSQYFIDLIKNKSSSVPQMKMDELKFLVKEKNTSKDAIEEVNRMFATVRNSHKSFQNGNLPLVRKGPRVLPVVKNMDMKKMNIENMEKINCRYCSSCIPCGDSCLNPQCYNDMEYEACDKKCLHRMCCHYQNKRKIKEFILCDKCRNSKNNHQCEHYDHGVQDTTNEDIC